jgi:hypothetical protein
MLLRKNYRHTGMDLRDEFIGLACDNCASAQPLPQIRDLSSFSQRPAKVNGRPSFIAIANGSFGFAVLRHS